MEKMDEGEDTKQEEEIDYQTYLAERKILIDAERDTAQQFDKAILTLAAGALALSITFINQIAPQPKPNSIGFLITAWSLFAFSILFTLISFLSSQAACRQMREVLDSQITGKVTCRESSAKTWTNVLNYLSIGSFILGVIFLVVFSSINLFQGGKDMKDEKKKIQEGYVPPEPPVKMVINDDNIEKKGFVPQKPPAKPETPMTPKDKK